MSIRKNAQKFAEKSCKLWALKFEVLIVKLQHSVSLGSISPDTHSRVSKFSSLLDTERGTGAKGKIDN
jgi:hypothetical protein